MSSGTIFDDKLGFSFEINLHGKQLCIIVSYNKDHNRVNIVTKTLDARNYPSCTVITSTQTISIDPSYCAIIRNKQFWNSVNEVLENIHTESEKYKENNVKESFS